MTYKKRFTGRKSQLAKLPNTAKAMFFQATADINCSNILGKIIDIVNLNQQKPLKIPYQIIPILSVLPGHIDYVVAQLHRQAV